MYGKLTSRCTFNMAVFAFILILLLVNFTYCSSFRTGEDDLLARYKRAAKIPLTEDLFMERCQHRMDHLPALKEPSQVECQNWWNTLLEVSRCEGQCKRNDRDMYLEFIDQIPPKLKQDSVSFWSGNGVAERASKIANEYNGYTLEQTRLGFILNGVWWCCAEGGVLKDECPDCNDQVDGNFWYAASRKYAEFARGQVHAILDGSQSETPYFPGSYFAKYEVPYLTKDAVTTMAIHLTYNGDNKDVTSTCDNESIDNLINEMKPVQVTCTANEYSTVHCNSKKKRQATRSFELNHCIRPSILDITNDAKTQTSKAMLIVVGLFWSTLLLK